MNIRYIFSEFIRRPGRTIAGIINQINDWRNSDCDDSQVI